MFVVVLQSELLDRLATRVVAPLIPQDRIGAPLRTLNPVIQIGDTAYCVMPQLVATLTLGELGVRIGSLAMHRDEIVRAVDALLSGI